MRLRRGWIKALAIGIALGLTGCGMISESGDSSNRIAEELLMEETAESLPEETEGGGEEETLSGGLGAAGDGVSRTVSDAVGTEASQEMADREETVSQEMAESGTRLTFSLGGDISATGFPQKAIDQAEAINRGNLLADTIRLDELEGCYALIATHTIIGKDAETGEEAVGSGELTFYVPNLLEGLEDVAVLFYSKAAGQWEILPVERMDTEARTVSVTLTGSGVLTVIYRRQDEQKDEGNTDENS